MKHLFWKIYIVVIGILLMAGIATLSYVNMTLKEYEMSQPEKVVEQELAKFSSGANCEEYMEFPVIKQLEYDKKLEAFSEYKNKLANAKEFTYKVKTGNFSETGQQYYVLADNEPVAVVELESTSEKIKLGILKVMQWKLKDITPILALTTYEYTATVPNDFSVEVNGTLMELSGDVENTDWKMYDLGKLYSEPDIVIKDRFGFVADFDIEENNVVPIVYTYSLLLPNEYSVVVEDTNINGKQTENKTEYLVETAREGIKISDKYGNEVEYTGNQEIKAFEYEFEIPSNYEIKVADIDKDSLLVGQADNSKYQYCTEYAEMPKQNTYKIGKSLKELDIKVMDNLGNNVDYVIKNGKVKIDKQAGLSEIPDDIKGQVDVMKLAKTWSLFMTQDLSGTNNGFNTIKEYLIKDSYMYKVAYKWATGVDITFTSAHRTSDNYFENENVTNFIRYSDKLFSCDITFMKYMYLYKSNIWVDDPMNSTFYFLNIGTEEKPKWVILDIQEIVER